MQGVNLHTPFSILIFIYREHIPGTNEYVMLTSASGWYHAGSDVVGSNRYSIPDDPRVAERELWFLFRSRRRLPGT